MAVKAMFMFPILIDAVFRGVAVASKNTAFKFICYHREACVIIFGALYFVLEKISLEPKLTNTMLNSMSTRYINNVLKC